MRNAEGGTRNCKAGSCCGVPLGERRAGDLFRVPRSTFRVLLVLALSDASLLAQSPRPRARDLGIVVGVLAPGPLDAITDVAGVRVGHVTIARGDSINTGVTAILPHEGNVFREKVPAAIVVGNGFGKLVGATQLNELGELESPIVLTCTLCVPRAADAVLTYLLGLPGNEDVRSANPVVAETNDGFLSDIRTRPISEGIGSVILVVATDAPLDHRQLERLGRRALAGLARTGSSMSNGSGDYVVAFSTWRTSGQAVGRSTSPTNTRPPDRLTDTLEVVTNDAMSPLFEAAIESSEEAIYNSLLRAETVRGYRGTAPALPLDSTVAILKRHGAIRP